MPILEFGEEAKLMRLIILERKNEQTVKFSKENGYIESDSDGDL